jgi:hypothetical protein
MGAATALGVILLVLACYQIPRKSLSDGFVRLWYMGLVGASLFSAAVPPVVAFLMPARAVAGSCQTRPGSFSVQLPLELVLPRAGAGALWGALAFVALSLLATRLGSLGPRAGGFFHYRGCPWPRWSPKSR